MSPLYRTPPPVATLAALVTAVVLTPGSSRAHSHADLTGRFVVREADVEAELRLTLRDLRHMVPVDRDGDDRLSPSEVEAAALPLGRHLERTLRLNTAPDHQPCTLQLKGLRLVSVSAVEATLAFHCPRAVDRLVLSAGLFGGTGHHFELVALFENPATGQQREVRLSTSHNRAAVELVGEERVGLNAVVLLAAVSAISLGVTLLWLLRYRRRRAASQREPNRPLQ